MNIVLLSTDLVTASRFDAKFDKTKPRPYNCNAFIIKSTCVVCDVQKRDFFDDTLFAFGYLELLEGNTDFFTFDFAKNFELHVEA